MKFVDQEYKKTYEEKKSKFIAYLIPYEKFNSAMTRLRNEHPKGRHFVYAYRYLNEYGQIVENSSDDGEPKGTSGKPSLAVLSGADIINSAVIIVRYFGGIKLGTGGLVRAYGESVNQVLSLATFKIYKKLILQELECEYNELSKLEYLLNQNNIVIRSKEFTTNIKLQIELSIDEWIVLKKQIPRTVTIQ